MDPAPLDTTDVCVTCFAASSTLKQAEASIAMHPGNPRTLLVTTNAWTDSTYSSSPGTTPAYSTDGGVTWTVQEAGTGGNSQGDPGAGIDADGRFFNCYNGHPQYSAARSLNGGASWTAYAVDAAMADRGHLWIDNASSLRRIYVAAMSGDEFVTRAAFSINNGVEYINAQNIGTGLVSL
jgi:hypothetical protein